MEIAEVIKMRKALKGGINIPLTIYIDNTFRVIEERNAFQFTKWDDENGILYNFSLTDVNMSSAPSNKEGTISVFAVNYTSIQCMEAARVPLAYLPNITDTIIGEGCHLTEDTVNNLILKRFKDILNADLTKLGPTEVNRIMGVVDGNTVGNDKDDYYEGKFTQSFQETAQVNRINDNLK